MIQRPPGVGAFQFVVLSTLRAAQLIRGCTPKIASDHKKTVIAQVEIAEGKVMQVFDRPAVVVPIGINAAPLEPVALVVQPT